MRKKAAESAKQEEVERLVMQAHDEKSGLIEALMESVLGPILALIGLAVSIGLTVLLFQLLFG